MQRVFQLGQDVALTFYTKIPLFKSGMHSEESINFINNKYSTVVTDPVGKNAIRSTCIL